MKEKKKLTPGQIALAVGLILIGLIIAFSDAFQMSCII